MPRTLARGTRAATPLALLALLAAAPAAADILYEGTLDGAQAGTPSSAVGTATLVLDEDAMQVEYEVTFTPLAGDEIAAHFHRDNRTPLGPVVLTLPLGSPKIGTWNVTQDDVDDLNEGRIYAVIHSTVYQAGEIRGTIGFSAVPERGRTWGAVKALYR